MHNERTGEGSRSRWIGTDEVAQRLGVRPATVYAYVSRGLLASRRAPGVRGSLFDRVQVDRLATGGRRAAGDLRRVHRFRSVATAVSHSSQDGLHYHGLEVAQWSFGRTWEDGVELLLGVRPGRQPPPRLHDADLAALASVPLDRRVAGTVGRLAERGWGRSTDLAAAAAAALVPTLVAAMAGPRALPGAGRLAEQLVVNLRGREATGAEADALDQVLLQLLDHGLTASTTATRAAASARAGIADCLLAGYAALAGSAHGAASAVVHRTLLQEVEHPGSVPPSGIPPAGFGHFLYVDGDPRADVALAALARIPAAAAALGALERLRSRLPEETRCEPNIDGALAVATVTLGVPAEAGPALFALARTAGLAAHAIEEYQEDLLRWRGRAATRAGSPPP